MREAFQILLEKLCCFGIGGIAVFLFVRATLPSVSSQIVTPVRDAVRKRRVSAIIPIVCACGMIAYAVVKNDASRVGNARSLAPAVRSQEMSLIEPWFLRGGRDTGHILTFDGDWCFPCGTNHLERVEVWGSGAVYPSEQDSTPITELGARLLLKPYVTRVSCGRTTNNTYRIEWRDAYVSRTSNEAIDASIELFRNGDVIVTENGVTTEIPYEIPFDHNGYGQDEDWVRANYDNADEILSVGYANWVDAQVGVGLTNGFYKFTACFEDDPPEPTQLYIGDFSVCVTNAGEYVFVLEKGTEYEFGTWPLNDGVDYWAQDDLAADAPMLTAWWGGWEAPGEWMVDGGEHWLDYPGMPEWGYRPGWCCWLPTLQGSPNVGHLGVASFPQSFEAILSDYCGNYTPSYQWSSSDPSMTFSTPNAPTTTVTCASIPRWNMCSMSVQANLGGFSLWSYLHPTYGTNENPHVYVTLKNQSVMFVNDDHRSTRYYEVDVSVLSDVSTNGHVRLVHVGDTNPEFYSDRGTNRVDLLNEAFSVDKEFRKSILLCPQKCGRGALIAECITADGDLISCTNSYRVIEPVCEIVNSDMNSDFDQFLNPSRIVVGEPTRIRVGVAGGDFSFNEVDWMVLGAEPVLTNEWELIIKTTSTNEAVAVCAAFNDDVEQPIIVMPSVSKRILPVKGFVVSHPDEVYVDPDAIKYMIDWANIVYRQVGIEFVLTNTIQNVGSADQWDLTYTKWVEESGGRRLELSDAAQSLLDTYSRGDCLEIYLVGDIKGVESHAHGMNPAAVWTPRGIFVRHDCTTALPHELGHALGLSDCYDYVGNIELPDLHNPVCASQFSHSTQDFFGGVPGRGFYSKQDTREVILKRLLMYGISSGGGCDIPLGAVKAFSDFETSNPEEGFVDVGCLSFHESDSEVFSR